MFPDAMREKIRRDEKFAHIARSMQRARRRRGIGVLGHDVTQRREILAHERAHGRAVKVLGTLVMLGEARAQRRHFLLGGERVVRHHLEQVTEPHRGEIGALQHQRLLLALVLQRRLHMQVLRAVGDKRRILLEELREVEVLPAVVGLLVEVHRADAHLRLLEVGREHEDEVVGPHVAEQAHEAALVELHQLLGDADRLKLGIVHPPRDEDVARDAGDVLLDQGVAVREEVEPVGRQQVLQFQAVDARGIRLLHVEVVLVVVVGVDHAHAERRRVAEAAEIHAVDVEVLHHRQVAVDLQAGVDALQALVERGHLLGTVDHRVPQRGPALGVAQRDRLVEVAEPLVRHRQFALAPVAVQVGAQPFTDRNTRLLRRGRDETQVLRHARRLAFGASLAMRERDQ